LARLASPRHDGQHGLCVPAHGAGPRKKTSGVTLPMIPKQLQAALIHLSGKCP
jgi:hypothetical protein